MEEESLPDGLENASALSRVAWQTIKRTEDGNGEMTETCGKQQKTHKATR